MRFFVLTFLTLLISACSTNYSNQTITGQVFPSISGATLEQNKVNIPEDFNGNITALLIGYKHKSQFDIDRWLIGLDMTETQVDVYELPTIPGLFPRMFSSRIDNSMREGIPEPLWKGVITIYEDADTVQAFTGNDNAKNSRVILLDENGKVLYFYDQGFSVAALNQFRSVLGSATDNN